MIVPVPETDAKNRHQYLAQERQIQMTLYPGLAQQAIYEKYEQLIIVTSNPNCPTHTHSYSDDMYDYCQCDTDVKYDHDQIYEAVGTLISVLKKNTMTGRVRNYVIKKSICMVMSSVNPHHIVEIIKSYM